MGEAREEQILSIVELLAPGTPIGVLGEAGIGTSTVLAAVAAALGGPVVRSGGLRSLRRTPFVPLNRALATDVGREPAALPRLLDQQVGDGVLVIDDLQWADGDTLAALAIIAPRVRVLAGIRRGDEGEPAASAALAAAGGTLLRLAPLDDEDCAVVVRAARPDLGTDVVDTLVQSAAGNPLVLQQLLVGGEVSATLADALRACIDGCDEPGRQALAVLAGRGDGLPAVDVGPSLDELVAAELVTIRDGRALLRHRLTGAAAADALDEDGRRTVHRRLAGLAEAPGDRARHLADAGDLELALPLALAAAAASTAGERSDHLELAARCTDGADRVRLLVEAADAALATRDIARARALADEALAVPATTPVPEALAAAAEARARDGAAAEALDAAGQVDPTAPPADRARALAASALALAWPLWRPREALAAAEQAIHLREGNPSETDRAALGVARLVAGDLRWREVEACLGPTARAFGALLSGRAELPPSPSRGSGWPVDGELLAVVVAFHATGDCDGVAARLHRLLEQIKRPIDREVASAHLAVALADSGRTSAAADLAAAALRTEPSPAGRALLTWALVEAELAGGRLTKARAAAARFDAAVPSPAATLGVLAGTWAAVTSPGEPVAAPDVPPPTPWPGLVAAELELCALALRDGAPAEVEAAFLAAAAAWEGWHRRGDLRCRWAAADAARSGGATEDAIARLLSIEDEASRLGQRPLVARVRASLRAAGVRTRPSRGPGRGTLSAREVEVLELVRLGFTTVEASQSLGVAPSTVETQIESAMRKLDARTRLQAASLVAELAP